MCLWPIHYHQALLAAQCEVWAALMVELDEFIRKNDYCLQREPMGDEHDARLRALDAAVEVFEE